MENSHQKNSPYRMTVDLNVLDHLGINLYSNIAAVLTEVVANAWDADANNVNIEIDPKAEYIRIEDDGIGMTISDMNDKYLRVGYRRREEDTNRGRITAKGRKVMGRKGLGKLSLFSIADVIEVHSVKDGQKHGLQMTVDGIHESVRKKEPYYQPIALPKENVDINKGTLIILKKIKRQRLGKGMVAIRKRLARRFSVIGERENFRVMINNVPLTVADRGDLPVVQFLWNLGEQTVDLSSATKILEKFELLDRLEGWNENWFVRGWIGTAHRPKQLDNDDTGNLNSIVVFSRGRLFHENILDKLNDGRIYTKYLTGQIEADFLDDDEQSDIATSDRQRIQEDDPRYIQLMAFLRKQFSLIEKDWNDLRRKYEIKEATKNSPALLEWIDSLRPGFRKSAHTLIAKLSALPFDDDDDRKIIYKHGILAFERMRLRGSTDEFAENVHDVSKVLEILADRDSLEASLYRDIVKSRIDAIKDFQTIVDVNSKEKILQKYLFDHLWLLDPAWERANSSELMESRLLSEGVMTDDLNEKEKLGRVDIAYRTMAGKHIVVELKRANRKMKLLELVEQGQLYVDKIRKIKKGEPVIDVEVIFVLGKEIDEVQSNPERIKSSMDSISPGSKIVYYDHLIQSAQNAYREYLDKSKKLDKLEKIVDAI